MSAKMKTPAVVPDGETYTNLINLFAIFTEATNRMSALDAALQERWVDLIDEHRAEYTQLQSKISEADAAIRHIATQHPEWFEDTKSLKTPYGAIEFRSSSKLEVPNEELTIALIERMGEPGSVYLRPRKFLNLEALETLEDGDLKKLRINRVTADKCTVKPAKVDLGKAVKKAVEKEEEATA
jgi:hypothetical protein